MEQKVHGSNSHSAIGKNFLSKTVKNTIDWKVLLKTGQGWNPPDLERGRPICWKAGYWGRTITDSPSLRDSPAEGYTGIEQVTTLFDFFSFPHWDSHHVFAKAPNAWSCVPNRVVGHG